DLELVTIAMNRDVPVDVSFAKPTVLRRDDWRRQRVRRERGPIVAKHESEAAEHVRREHLIVGRLRERFAGGSFLALMGLFRQIFVGYVERLRVGTAVAPSAPARVPVVFELPGDSPARAMIGEVRFDRRIEIAIRSHALDAEANGGAALRVPADEIAAQGG